MKILVYTLMIMAFALVVFNITQLDFGNMLSGNSLIALIGIVASLCAILILFIFTTSKAIQDKYKSK